MTQAYSNFDANKIMEQLRANVRDIIRPAPIIVQAEVKKQLNQGASSRGATPSAPGDPPHKQDGRLLRSWQSGHPNNIVNETGLGKANPTIKTGSNLPYARIHEFGGIIKAKTGKFLAVP